jgi:hypothetical protein
MVKTKVWVIGILAALLLCGGCALWLSTRSAPGMVANIYVDGECIHCVDLSQVTETETYTVEDDLGVNVIQIEPGRIRVLEADCPDQVCVDAGWLTDSAAPIVCLPHRLVIRLEGAGAEGGVDAVTQ